MKAFSLVAGSFLALSATGCFATKGDMRLLQEEIRATRAQVARADSIQRRTSDSLTVALANLARVQALAVRDATQAQQKTNDELKALTTRVTNNDIATREQLKSLDADLGQVREIVRQNSRSGALARAAEEQRRPVTMNAPDTTATPVVTPPASTTPGPATLLVSGRTQIVQGSCATARRAFQDLLAQYPDSPEAPEALWSIAESYVACADGGNPARADSVHRLVVERYPRSEFAPLSLYKRAEMLRTAGKAAEAKPLYERVVCDYPRSDVVQQALNRLGGRRPATC
jgi:TolA-binding protein